MLKQQEAELALQRSRLASMYDSSKDEPTSEPQAFPTPPAPPQVNRGKILKNLAEMRIILIEAVANYGDTMTTVKPNEFINLIFWTENLDASIIGFKTHYDIISVQKSWIAEYKAGKRTMEDFKQKVLQYTE